MIRVVILLVLGATACKSGSKADQSAATPLGFGTTIHPFGELEGISIGMPMKEVRAKVPRLAPIPEEPDVPGGIKLEVAPAPPTPAGFLPNPVHDSLMLATPSASYTVHSIGDRLVSVEITIEHRAANELWRAWGTPVDTGRRKLLFDRARKLRASVEAYAEGPPLTVTIEEIMPLENLIDADPKRFAGIQVIGRPLADVMRELAPRARLQVTKARYALPPSEYSSSWTWAEFYVDDADLVTGWDLGSVLFDNSDAAFEDVIATYTKTWGKPLGVTDLTVVFRRDPLIEVSRETGSVMVGRLE